MTDARMNQQFGGEISLKGSARFQGESWGYFPITNQNPVVRNLQLECVISPPVSRGLWAYQHSVTRNAHIIMFVHDFLNNRSSCYFQIYRKYSLKNIL